MLLIASPEQCIFSGSVAAPDLAEFIRKDSCHLIGGRIGPTAAIYTDNFAFIEAVYDLALLRITRSNILEQACHGAVGVVRVHRAIVRAVFHQHGSGFADGIHDPGSTVAAARSTYVAVIDDML